MVNNDDDDDDDDGWAIVHEKKLLYRRNPFNRKNQGNSGIFGKYEFSCNFPEQIIKNINIKIGKLTVIMELKVKNII